MCIGQNYIYIYIYIFMYIYIYIHIVGPRTPAADPRGPSRSWGSPAPPPLCKCCGGGAYRFYRFDRFYKTYRACRISRKMKNLQIL